MKLTKPQSVKSPLLIFYRDPVICFISVPNRPFDTWAPHQEQRCLTEGPAQLHCLGSSSVKAETVVKWTVCHFGRASIRLRKKDRVLQLYLPPPPSLIDIHRPPLHPRPSVVDGGTFAVSGHYSQPRCPFISQSPHGGAAMNQFGVFMLKHPRVTQINWAL